MIEDESEDEWGLDTGQAGIAPAARATISLLNYLIT